MLTFFIVSALFAAVANIAYAVWLLLTERSTYFVVPIAAVFLLLGAGNIANFLYRTAPTHESALFYVRVYSTIGALGIVTLFEGSLMLPLAPHSKWMHLLSIPALAFIGVEWMTNLVQVDVTRTRAGWLLTNPGKLYSAVVLYTYLLAVLALMVVYGFFRAQANQRFKRAAGYFLLGASIFMAASFLYYVIPVTYAIPDPTPLSSVILVLLTAWGFQGLGEPHLVKIALSQTLLEVSPDLVLVTSPEGEILYFNSTVRRYIPEISDADSIHAPPVFGAGFSLDKPEQEITVSDKVFLVESISLTDKWGQPGYLIIGRDITEMKHLMAQLETLSITDPLTGLYNRRYLMMRLEQEVSLAKRYGRNFLVFMLDLDDFKLINDSLGHRAGDQMLRQVAEIMKNQLRDTDVVARYGGDEFAGILITNELQQGEKVLSRILETLRNTSFEWQGHSISGSFSAGLTSFQCSGEDSESLLTIADMALYKAKKSGKGCVKVSCPRDMKL